MPNYIIYDALDQDLPAEPFLCAKTLLEKLYIANQTVKTNRPCPCFIERHELETERFVTSLAVVLAQAGKNNEKIIALDDNSYSSLKFSKKYMTENYLFRSKIEKMLNLMELTTDFLADTAHINGLFLKPEIKQKIEQNLKLPFDNFSAATYVSSTVYLDSTVNAGIDELFETIKLKRIHFDRELKPSGFEIRSHVSEIAFKMAAAVMMDALDSGSDFLVVSDLRIFYMFDTCKKKIEKAAGRNIPLYLLTLPQVVMIALGITDKKILGFKAHKTKPALLG